MCCRMGEKTLPTEEKLKKLTKILGGDIFIIFYIIILIARARKQKLNLVWPDVHRRYSTSFRGKAKLFTL